MEKKFVAISAYNQAVSVTKIREYLALLKDMEVLEEDGEELKWLGWPVTSADTIGKDGSQSQEGNQLGVQNAIKR